MGKESSLARYIIDGLRPHCDIMRVENPILPGTPDINGCYRGQEFWIELKEIDDFPKRPETPVKVNHFTPFQRNWIKRRSLYGGHVFMVIKVKETREWFLLDGEWAADNIDSVSQEYLRLSALRRWKGRIDFQQLIAYLHED